MKPLLPNIESDYQKQGPGENKLMQPMYQLPGARGRQQPESPGDRDGVDIYTQARYLRRNWGIKSLAVDPNTPFQAAWPADSVLQIDHDCQVLQIGSQSEAYAMRVFHSGANDYVVVSADSPYIGTLKAPILCVPAMPAGDNAHGHVLEVVAYTRPPRQLILPRAPQLYTVIGLAQLAAVDFPTLGRRYIRVTITGGVTQVTLATGNAIDGAFANPRQYGVAGNIFTGMPVVNTADDFIILDTINNPDIFKAQRLDFLRVQPTGGPGTANVQIYVAD